jgi:hypothetical protein
MTGDRTAMADALARVRAGEDDPPCAKCHAGAQGYDLGLPAQLCYR